LIRQNKEKKNKIPKVPHKIVMLERKEIEKIKNLLIMITKRKERNKKK
jgi:hypothetical protein